MNSATTASLGELLTEHRERVAVQSGVRYPIAGVYGFGRGMLLRDSVAAEGIAATSLYRIRAGQIIYSRLKAFENLLLFPGVMRVAVGRGRRG